MGLGHDIDTDMVGTWCKDMQYDRILSKKSFHHSLDVAQIEEASEAIVTRWQ